MYMAHGNSLPGIDNQGNRSRSRSRVDANEVGPSSFLQYGSLSSSGNNGEERYETQCTCVSVNNPRRQTRPIHGHELT